MKVKRYIAENTQEAVGKIKKDLGNNAVILNTRKIRKGKGLIKYFTKPLIEILAASEDTPRNNDNMEKGRKDTGVWSNGVQPMVETRHISSLEKRVDDINATLTKLYNKIHHLQGGNDYPDNVQPIVDRLMENEVVGEIIDDLVKGVLNEPTFGDSPRHDILFQQAITYMLGEARPLSLNNDRKIIMLLGPTGVGKTTTLAKLAAIYSTQTRKKVGLITADTYRIAAVEQLKTYAEILDLPLQIVYSPDEISEAIYKHSDKDLIFIDTPGRNLKEKQQYDELKQLVTLSKADEIFLTISGTTSYGTISGIINSYSFISDYKIIVTKLDESTALGNVVNIRRFTNNPFAYITTGQNVPDDIEVFRPETIAKTLVGSNGI